MGRPSRGHGLTPVEVQEQGERSLERHRRAERFARAAIVAILVLLGGLTFSAALRDGASADRIERQVALLEAYLDMHQAVGTMRGVEHAYAERGGRGARVRFRRAERALHDSLAVLTRQGASDDRALANAVRRHAVPYRIGANRVFREYDAGRHEAALELDDRLVDPPVQALGRVVNQRSPRHARDTLRDARAMRGSSDLLLRTVVAGIPIALIAVGALWGVLLAYRRRLSDASSRELERLRRAALEDSLTGLGNHRAFHEALAAAERSRELPFSLVLIDVEGLKRVNDIQGLQAGDERLVALARRLTAALDPALVFRVGGDEFAALLPGRGAWDAFAWLEDLARAAAVDRVGFRAGVAEAASGDDRDTLIEEVNLALVHARQANRAVVVYSDDLGAAHERAPAGEAQHRQTLASALAQAVDAKDSYTRSHCETVSTLCVMIADELDLDPRRIARLRLAGLLHDVGKIGVPDEILQKPAPLTAEEFQVMKGHSTLGARIARSADLREEAEWIRHHHERLDGRGYPDGLRGEAIPLESRVILVADAFEAMTSDRPYRRGSSEREALTELEEHAGTQFDPQVVDALERALGRRGAPSFAGASRDASGRLGRGSLAGVSR